MKSIVGSRSPKDLAYNVMVFLLYLFILTFLLRYLWNATLVKHFTILRPITGTGVKPLLDTFLLALAISMFKL